MQSLGADPGLAELRSETALGLEGGALTKEDYSQNLRSLEFVLLGFGLVWDISTFPSFPFSPHGMGMSLLCLSYHYILATHDLSGFIVHSQRRILPQNESYF